MNSVIGISKTVISSGRFTEAGRVRQAPLTTAMTTMSRSLPRIILYLTLIFGAIVFIFPLVWMVSTSLKPMPDVFLFPPNFIPSSFQWTNYTEALELFPFMRSFRNTMIIVVGVEIGRLFSSSLAAYGFARLRFPLRNTLFVIVLSTMMLPYHVVLIPQFLVFRDLGWLNSFLPLTVPAFFATSAFFVFLLRQFFMGIPKEYDDSAEIDGCTPIGIYWHIILPMSLPALGAVAIFTYMAEWNDFFAPLIYLNTQELFTLALQFKIWELSAHTALNLKPHPFNQIMAIATLITLIPVIVFFFAQRYFIQGVVISGIKG